MANFTALKTAINNAIKTNGNEEITGAILQAILDAMVETLGDSAINDLENAITTEVTNRENAVGGVADDLAAEVQARQALDYNVNNRINAEEYNRQNADAALSQTMSQGFQTLGSQMTALNAAISALNAAYQNGYLYGGIATPSSSPSNNKCFYIALQGGTYTNFGGVGVVEGINIIKNDSGWKVEHIYDQTTLLNEFYLLRQQVIQAITSFTPIVIEGDVTNAPDEEDLTSNANHLLQFKNNAYSPLEFSGLGRKYLRKNIAPLSESAPFNGFVEGVTAEETLSGTPTQIFWDRMNTRFVGIKDGVYYLDWTGSDNYVPVSTSLVYMYNATPYKWNGSEFYVDEDEVPNLKNVLTRDMMTEANTIYIIRDDFTLAEDITIPANCVLQFDGGSISGEHTITGANTGIQAGLVKIFSTDVTLAGSWNVAEAYPEWFGAKGNAVSDDTDAIQKALNSFSTYDGENLSISLLPSKTYIISDTLIVNENTSLVCKSFLHTDNAYIKTIVDKSAIQITPTRTRRASNITFKNLKFMSDSYNNHCAIEANCFLNDISFENIKFENFEYGVYFDQLLSNNDKANAYNILFKNILINGNIGLPIYIKDASWIGNIQILDCEFYNTKIGGIKINTAEITSVCSMKNTIFQECGAFYDIDRYIENGCFGFNLNVDFSGIFHIEDCYFELNYPIRNDASGTPTEKEGYIEDKDGNYIFITNPNVRNTAHIVYNGSEYSVLCVQDSQFNNAGQPIYQNGGNLLLKDNKCYYGSSSSAVRSVEPDSIVYFERLSNAVNFGKASIVIENLRSQSTQTYTKEVVKKGKIVTLEGIYINIDCPFFNIVYNNYINDYIRHYYIDATKNFTSASGDSFFPFKDLQSAIAKINGESGSNQTVFIIHLLSDINIGDSNAELTRSCKCIIVSEKERRTININKLFIFANSEIDFVNVKLNKSVDGKYIDGVKSVINISNSEIYFGVADAFGAFYCRYDTILNLNRVTINKGESVVDTDKYCITGEFEVNPNNFSRNYVTQVSVTNNTNLGIPSATLNKKAVTKNTNRPSLTNKDAGCMLFDKTLVKPIWWTGSGWVDATGATV